MTGQKVRKLKETRSKIIFIRDLGEVSNEQDVQKAISETGIIQQPEKVSITNLRKGNFGTQTTTVKFEENDAIQISRLKKLRVVLNFWRILDRYCPIRKESGHIVCTGNSKAIRQGLAAERTKNRNDMTKNRQDTKHTFPIVQMNFKKSVPAPNLALAMAKTARLFSEVHLDREQISRATVLKTLKRFFDTGHVKNLPKSGRLRTETDNENAFNVLLEVVETPKWSL
ncbi:hypothetical protein FQR65_LT02122 [Abscondita terminalis]|nr:hypothetical protein FQR65_LT02122 [Abscondita terminalis]